VAPKTNLYLCPFDLTDERLFLTSDFLIHPETHTFIQFVTSQGQVQQAIQQYGNQVLSAPGPALCFHIKLEIWSL
jgi:hypothetical protein